MLDDQGLAQAAAQTNNRDAAKPTDVGKLRTNGARLHALVPEAEETGRPYAVSARQWPPDPARGQHRHDVSQ